MSDFIAITYCISMVVMGILATLFSKKAEKEFVEEFKEKYPNAQDSEGKKIFFFSLFLSVFMPVYNTGLVVYGVVKLLQRQTRR